MTSTVYIPTVTIDDQTGGTVTTGYLPLDSLPTYSKTLLASQVIVAGVIATMVGPVVLPAGRTLTIAGLLQITNTVFSG